MDYFDTILTAARNKDNATIEKLLIKGHDIDPIRGLNLTPAGQLAKEKDWNTAHWLMTNYQANPNKIVYGAILGGTSEYELQQLGETKICKEATEIFEKCDTHFKLTLLWQAKARTTNDKIERYSYLPAKMRLYAIQGAAYANNQELLEYLLTKEHKEYDETHRLEAIKFAAFGGHQLIVNKMTQTLKDFDHALMGIGAGRQFELLKNLKTVKSYYFPSMYMTKSAIFHEHYEFCLTLLKNHYTTQSSLILYTASAACLFNKQYTFLNHLLAKHADQDWSMELYVAVDDFVTDSEKLLNFVCEIDSPSVVTKFLDFFAQERSVNTTIKSDISAIKKQYQDIHDLKQTYCLNTKQAMVLYDDPSLKTMLLDKEINVDNLVKLLQEKDLDLNRWQLKGLVLKLRKNQPRAELINKLTEYTQMNLFFRYGHHQRRATSLLEEITQMKSGKKLKQTVIEQLVFFNSEKPSGHHEAPKKHLRPMKNKGIKDEFYIALKSFPN